MKRILSSVLSLLLAHLMYAQHAVDLGLSVLWADRNVGADSPGSPGIFVSWGELEPKSEYLMSNYRFCTGDFCSPTKYYAYNPDEVLTVPDGKTVSGFPALEIDLWRRCMVRLKQLGKK